MTSCIPRLPNYNDQLCCPNTGGYSVPSGQDIMISVYNIHRSPAVWDDPDAFQPERFGPLDGPVPSEQNTDYRYIPFSGGPR